MFAQTIKLSPVLESQRICRTRLFQVHVCSQDSREFCLEAKARKRVADRAKAKAVQGWVVSLDGAGLRMVTSFLLFFLQAWQGQVQ